MCAWCDRDKRCQKKWRCFHDKVCEMEAILSVGGSRWSRCCNINSSVSTCWNTAAASLQATALPPIHTLNVLRTFTAADIVTVPPRVMIYASTHLVCHKAIFHIDNFLLDHILCQGYKVLGVHHSAEGWFLQINILSTYSQPQGSGKLLDYVTYLYNLGIFLHLFITLCSNRDMIVVFIFLSYHWEGCKSNNSNVWIDCANIWQK